MTYQFQKFVLRSWTWRVIVSTIGRQTQGKYTWSGNTALGGQSRAWSVQGRERPLPMWHGLRVMFFTGLKSPAQFGND